MKTEIIYEDKEILVIYKPEGLAAQSARVTQPDVVSEMCTYLKGRSVFPVHRLDQPVEGLMVLAKTKFSAASLSAQLQNGSLKKTYLAVVAKDEGDAKDIPEAWTEVTDYMFKDSRAAKAEISDGDTNAGEKAVKATLFYRRIGEAKGDTALLEIHLITGRFHQIRAQLAHQGMPLLGDVKYGSEKSREVTGELARQIPLGKVALCAYKLEFLHPKSGKEMHFEIKPHKPVFNSYEI